MSEDVVRALGHLTLGSRLKRLGELLHGQAQPVLEESGSNLSAACYPMLAALDRGGPLGAVELAAALGVSQPGATRMLEKLKSAGLVRASRTGSDRRQRPMALTRAGQSLLATSKQHTWPVLEAAVIDACGPGGALLEQVRLLEDALAAQPLAARASRIAARRRTHAPA